MSLSICHCKRYIALALCALFLFQAAGWQLAWMAARTEARRQSFYHIEHHAADEVLTLTLSSVELASMLVGKDEIRFHNRLYDIRTLTVYADSTRLEAYPDSLEEALIGTLGALLSPDQSDTQGTPVYALLAQWIGLVYLMPDASAWSAHIVSSYETDSFEFAMPPLADYASCFSPPPEL